MNLDIIREEVANLLNKNVSINVYGMRNKTYYYEGILSAVYPYVFTVNINGVEKSFNYSDVIIGDVVINELK